MVAPTDLAIFAKLKSIDDRLDSIAHHIERVETALSIIDAHVAATVADTRRQFDELHERLSRIEPAAVASP